MSDPPVRHIAIFEPDPSGHRMVFVRYILEAIARRGGIRATLILCPEASQTAQVVVMREAFGNLLAIHTVPDPDPMRGPLALSGKLARQIGFARRLREAVTTLRAQGEVNHVHIPFADDYVLFPFAMRQRPFGDIPWSGIVIRPRFHLARAGAIVPARREDRVEAWAYRRLLRGTTLRTLFSIDPFLASQVDDPRIVTVCDPADITDRTPQRDWLPVGDDATVLLAYGYVDHRKAIDRLLRCAADPSVPKSLVVALVGVQDPAMHDVLQGPDAALLRQQGRLVEVARHVTDTEEASAFARADIVWCYYPGSYCSSGAMVRAGQMGKPLLAGTEGLVGHLTRQHDLGLTAPEYDDAALTGQLACIAGDAALRTRLGTAGERHFATATGHIFGDRIVTHIAGQEADA
ncbi:hypothetical protein ACQHGV_16365 (plasmid) [Sphingomonas pseudosanguinis]|uniref:hypothetical protein n=1 Tax=Sphingomonas pseudosanguinis TaxID=413712 RepID=UPI003F83732C